MASHSAAFLCSTDYSSPSHRFHPNGAWRLDTGEGATILHNFTIGCKEAAFPGRSYVPLLPVDSLAEDAEAVFGSRCCGALHFLARISNFRQPMADAEGFLYRPGQTELGCSHPSFPMAS